MKKLTIGLAVAASLAYFGSVGSSSADAANYLPMSVARQVTTYAALNAYLSDSDSTDYGPGKAIRRSARKIDISANVYGTHEGRLICGTYSCHETDTEYQVWWRVSTILRPPYKVIHTEGTKHYESHPVTHSYSN
jgi:hypothetical protein